jgi:hypothetical protein
VGPWGASGCISTALLVWYFSTICKLIGHSKEALDLAHVQEQTKQLEKQEKIKVVLFRSTDSRWIPLSN